MQAKEPKKLVLISPDGIEQTVIDYPEGHIDRLQAIGWTAVEKKPEEPTKKEK
ncbi:MAG: hypothetical protein LWW75_07440 [Chlorobiales bacterium]|nr:hypothetical protein [Chlorobiales bacterium]